MKSFVFLLLCWLAVSPVLNAQKDGKSSGDHQKADKAYDKLGYKEAIELYKAGKLDMPSMERMANSYRLNHDTQNAEKWYAQIVQSSENPLNALYYAQALQSNGNYEKAKEFYLKYDRLMGGSGDKRGDNLAQAIDRMTEFRNPQKMEVTNATVVNGNKLDFSPAFFENGIVFVSTRAPEGDLSKLTATKDPWTGDDFAAIYFAKGKADGTLEKPEVFSKGLATRFHEGPLCFSKNGEQLFFTKNNVKNNAWSMVKQLAKGRDELKLKIFVAEKSGDDWDKAESLPFEDKKSNDAHPSLAADGQRLFFASDREEGFGGMDLYVSVFSNGKWAAPTNLGMGINTAGNEVFPFIADDGTLYFASDGWGGLGGLDLFFADKIDERSFAKALNLGAPFNSQKDDFGYIINTLGTEGYFTSARDGGVGKDDIYRFTLPSPHANKRQGSKPIALCVYDEATGEKLAGASVTALAQKNDGSYQGFEEDFIVKLIPTENSDEFAISLKRRDPLGDAPSEEDNETYLTDEEGYFQMPLKEGKKYVFIAKKEGYLDATFEWQADASGENCIPMQVANCVMLKGLVLNRQYGKPIPNATVTLVNLCSGEISTLKSDASGHYQFPCLECGCDFVIRGAKANFKEDNALATTVERDCENGNPGEPIEQDLRLVPAMGPNGEPAIVTYRENGEPMVNYSDKNGDVILPGDLEEMEPETVDDMLAKGITIELKDIYYDFDKFNIRGPDATTDLDRLVDFMQRYPDISAELGSHTDCRADDNYNRQLAANRAKAAVEYVVKQGVERRRMVAKGYGEDMLVNECEDGVPCSEEAHQMNRRTEIRIFKRR